MLGDFRLTKDYREGNTLRSRLIDLPRNKVAVKTTLIMIIIIIIIYTSKRSLNPLHELE